MRSVLRGLSSGDTSVFLFEGAADDALDQEGTPGYLRPVCGLSIYEMPNAIVVSGDEERVEAIHIKIMEWNRKLSAMDVRKQAIVKEEARIYRHETTHVMRRMGATGEVISPRAGVRYDLGLGYEKEMLGGVCGLRDPERVYSLDVQKLPVMFWD
jgi:hypothetical protein